METLFIPTECDIKNWVKEATAECLENSILKNNGDDQNEDQLLNRKEMAQKTADFIGYSH